MSLTSQQRRTKKAREMFLESFDSDEARRDHMRQLAERSGSTRVILNADEAAALGRAYALLAKIHARHEAKLDRATESEAGDG